MPGTSAGAKKVKRENLLDRLSDKFLFMPDGCWHWTAARFENGYGAVWNNHRNRRAHRVMYELLHGPVPDGLELDHLCRVRHCVNPGHLEPVTRKENLRRSPHYFRVHCAHGHKFTPENTRYERGYRRCRTCNTNATRARRARLRSEAMLSNREKDKFA